MLQTFSFKAYLSFGIHQTSEMYISSMSPTTESGHFLTELQLKYGITASPAGQITILAQQRIFFIKSTPTTV